MADSKVEDEPILLLDRSSRPTRGKRMTRLVDEEIEEDELFWNQDALKEEENDDEYKEEGEVGDEFDSDFDEDESEPDDEVEHVAEEKLPVKKRLIFPGKTAPKKKDKKKTISKTEKEQTVEKEESEEKSEERKISGSNEREDGAEELEAERVVRKSTRTSVIVRQAERDAIRAALQATVKPIIKKKKEGEEKRMTQEEMLLEAAETEIMNLRNLERVLAREEEVKKRAIVHKAVYDGPLVRYLSRDGKSFIEFKGLTFDSELCTSSIPYPEKPVCAVTGLPAKYRDPKTGLPYATKEAFKIIRERFAKDEYERKKSTKKDLGELFNLISGEAPSAKRKRTAAMRTFGMQKTQRTGARFRKIPAVLESSDSD